MNALPSFTSLQDHIAHLGDVDFWQPYINEILKRHGLFATGLKPTAGFNPTYPTFLYGDVVVKFFGYSKSWQQRYAAEQAALALVATDRRIAAPCLLGYGNLYDNTQESWPYLIMRRMPGIAVSHVELTYQEKMKLAGDLGKQVSYIHALSWQAGVSTDTDWLELDIQAAAKQSSLPPHLVAQIDDYLTKLKPEAPVFTHGDLCDQHIFVQNGQLSGIIDWGDAMITDRHYELIQIYRGVFNCDKTLFQIFLEASNWPVGKDFATQALGQALRRQAIGVAQHHGMDVFEPIAKLFPLNDIKTLDQLAHELFSL
ncbi:aminoglycoside 3'-phosphotransferase/choline kinase family protein [Candidatus Dependentiae bacterium]|jgi:hygromycin-B 7''-O-kinase|nr:aminoglycoside 3'-phosphotransferase/choline kinase family protein [Candidatus Dependentiae bacterium]